MKSGGRGGKGGGKGGKGAGAMVAAAADAPASPPRPAAKRGGGPRQPISTHRILASETIPANTLVPNNENCFFGSTFTSELVMVHLGNVA